MSILGPATEDQWRRLIEIYGSEIRVRIAATERWPGRSIDAPLLAQEADEWLREPTAAERRLQRENPTLNDIAELGVFGIRKQQ